MPPPPGGARGGAMAAGRVRGRGGLRRSTPIVTIAALVAAMTLAGAGGRAAAQAHRGTGAGLAAGTIATVAGDGNGGFSGDGGPATGAEVDGPDGVAPSG